MQHAFKFNPDAKSDRTAATPPKVEYDFPAAGEKPNGIVLVGEAPGAEEARLGHPFVGRSGQLLDKILAKAEINRTQCLVANSFRTQPPGNKVDHFFISRRAAKEQGVAIAEEFGQFGSAWCRAEFAGDLEHLRETLAKYSASFRHPRESGDPSSDEKKWMPASAGMTPVIMALGRTALWALTGQNGLMEKIGKPLDCRLLPGTTVIPTFHPSFILRGNWARQDEWLGHFAAAKEFML